MIKQILGYLSVVVLSLNLLAGQLTTEDFSAGLSMADLEQLNFSELAEKQFVFPAQGWKFRKGDRNDFAEIEFDDREWSSVKAGQSLRSQRRVIRDYNSKEKTGWYRIAFELQKIDPEADYVLSLGRISSGEEVYLNGRLCGSYSFAVPLRKSDQIRRFYILDAEKHSLNTGKNVLALRIRLGHMGGLYSHVPVLLKLKKGKVAAGLTYRSPGKTAVHRQICGQKELNRFLSHEKIFIRPVLTVLAGRLVQKGKLAISVAESSGKNIWRREIPLEIRKRCWTNLQPLEIDNPGPGEYELSCTYVSNGRILWEQNAAFSVEKRKLFTIPVDHTLKRGPFPLKVNEYSYGSFGPRWVNRNNELVDYWRVQDSRGGLTMIAGFNPEEYPGPMIYLSHVKSMPRTLDIWKVSHSIGTAYDHFEDGWSMGCINAEKNMGKPELSTVETTWNKKTVRYCYGKDQYFDFTISNLSPAFTVRSTGLDSLCFFTPLLQNGMSAPQALYAADGNAFRKMQEKKMPLKENWMLVSWQGAEEYDEFDIPFLMVFEKKPGTVVLSADGLRVQFRQQKSGAIHVMPLHGMKLMPPDKPAEKTLALCRKWSEILPGLPDQIRRTARIDYHADRMLVHDRYLWKENQKDEWNTKIRKFAPVPPVLMLAVRGGLKVKTSAKISDLDYSTLIGPYCAAENVADITYVMEGYPHLARELRCVRDVPDNENTRHYKKILEQNVRRFMPEIAVHPWTLLVAHYAGRPSFGRLQPHVTGLLNALPYLPEDLGKQIQEEMLKEMQDSFFNDDLLCRNPKGKMLPVNVKVRSSLSGREFSVLNRHARHNGIDCPAWEALRLCLYYDVARVCNGMDLVRKNWPQVERSYHLLTNSHDWACSMSWDSYGGIRVGNGMQENSIFHGGLIAYARMARQLGHIEESDRAVYYALMQLPALIACTSSESTDYVRQERTLLFSHSQYADIEYLQRHRPAHHLEFSERSGFFQYIIEPRHSYFNQSFIMTRLPEIMRVFKDYMGKYTDEQMHVRTPEGPVYSYLDPPEVDHFVYLTDCPPFPPEKLLELRVKMLHRKGAGKKEAIKRRLLWEENSDRRALLDSYGKVYYRNLW